MTEIKEATPDLEWVMVPTKPTREMCFAGAVAGWAFNNVETPKVLGVYRAMLAARPVPSTEGWRDIASMPNDGRDVWVFGGRFFEPTVMPADGDWWRLPDSIQPPTHWMPFDRPSPPSEEPRS